jgi:transposase
MIDETSLRRRHRHVTVLINGDTGEGLAVVKHRHTKALPGFLVSQGHRWCRQVRVVISDGSESYRSAIHTHLGGATHVVDRFHVARWFAAALIEVRRRIQRIAPKGSRPAYQSEIFRSRYLQLRRADRFDPEAWTRWEQILTLHLDLAHAWALYQHLHPIYTAEDDTQANQALGAFIDTYQDRPLPEFETVIGALLDWKDEIFACHDTGRASNGRLEGTNNKLGVLKRIAYGFVNPDNFAARALLLTPGLAT